MMYGWDYVGFHWIGMFLGPVFLLVFIAVAAWVVASVFQATGFGNAPAERTSSALDILKERLAKGEINKDEYEEKRKLIEGS
jgi:putative membrane protein